MGHLGALYLLTSPSGKQYVGITSKTAEERFWKGHVRTARCKGTRYILPKAIRKYGPDAFKIETLLHAPVPMLKELEILAIQHFDTLAPAGYNLTIGGSLLQHSDELRKKMSNSAKRFWHDPFKYLRKVQGTR